MKDLFSAQAAEYARYRPRYPRALFEWVAGLPAGRERAWDCGTGNGQAAVALADFFTEVIGTEPSAAQLSLAEPCPRVGYAHVAESGTPFAPRSVDLVTAAQAAHWFDHAKFDAEIRRVGRPGGAVALWAYGHDREVDDPGVDKIVARYEHEVVGPYWAPEIALIAEGYRTIPFPFEEVAAPKFTMESELPLDGLVGYLSSFSARRTFMEKNARDPLDEVMGELRAAWGDPSTKRKVRWPVHMRAGRIG